MQRFHRTDDLQPLAEVKGVGRLIDRESDDARSMLCLREQDVPEACDLRLVCLGYVRLLAVLACWTRSEQNVKRNVIMCFKVRMPGLMTADMNFRAQREGSTKLEQAVCAGVFAGQHRLHNIVLLEGGKRRLSRAQRQSFLRPSKGRVTQMTVDNCNHV